MNKLARNIKKRLDDLNLTQATFAEKIGVSQVSIYKLLSGKTKSTGKLIQIAKVLKCDPEWLMYGTGEYDENVATHQIPLFTLQSYEKLIQQEKTLDNYSGQLVLEQDTSADFCIDYSSIDNFTYGDIGLLFENYLNPTVGDTVLYRIDNRYGSHVVIANYTEELGVPKLINVKSSKGKTTDIDLDHCDNEILAVRIGIISL